MATDFDCQGYSGIILFTYKPPKVVKFSGGRSSGMMLLLLLNDGELQAENGDVILFNNTSAEHPATYEFVRRVKEIVERKHNIPFFIAEFQTYEDAGSNYCWTRFPTWRLVNDQPYHARKNPCGYRYRGEVFEEMISWRGYLPSVFSRTCTASLKIFVSNSFLASWFSQKDALEKQGHFGDKSRMTDEEICFLHARHNGSTPKNALLEKKRYMRSRPHQRPAQKWNDYTHSKLCVERPDLQEMCLGDEATLYGDYAIDYVSFIGIRKDEEHRLRRLKHRLEKADAASKKSNASFFAQPPGESICAPLVDKGLNKEDVMAFWEGHPFDLQVPKNATNISNCVFCPLKGYARLLELAKTEKENPECFPKNTPASIDWWCRIEKEHSRYFAKENRKQINMEHDNIGFFGASSGSVYQKIREKAESAKQDFEDTLQLVPELPCDCTD